MSVLKRSAKMRGRTTGQDRMYRVCRMIGIVPEVLRQLRFLENQSRFEGKDERRTGHGQSGRLTFGWSRMRVYGVHTVVASSNP